MKNLLLAVLLTLSVRGQEIELFSTRFSREIRLETQVPTTNSPALRVDTTPLLPSKLKRFEADVLSPTNRSLDGYQLTLNIFPTLNAYRNSRTGQISESAKIGQGATATVNSTNGYTISMNLPAVDLFLTNELVVSMNFEGPLPVFLPETIKEVSRIDHGIVRRVRPTGSSFNFSANSLPFRLFIEADQSNTPPTLKIELLDSSRVRLKWPRGVEGAHIQIRGLDLESSEPLYHQWWTVPDALQADSYWWFDIDSKVYGRAAISRLMR
jgi:hypothetical protein